MSAKGIIRSKLTDLLRTYNFKIVCSVCSVKENEITYTLKPVNHQCSRDLLLAKVKGTSKWRPVSRRPLFPNPGQYQVCWFFVEGSGCTKHRNRCTFARSHEEATVWNFEKRQSVDHSTLISLITESERVVVQKQNIAEKICTEFSGEFQELCKDCFLSSPHQITVKRWNNTCSADAAHVWDPVLVHHLSESQGKEVYNQIRPLPPNRSFQYCNHVMQGMPCWHGSTQCQFAHSEVEMAVWRAENSGILIRQDVLLLSQEKQRCSQGVVPAPSLQAAIYCKACLLVLSSHESFLKHCASLGHAQMISEDTTTDWKRRPPPHGRKAEFWLCDRPETCEYGTNCVKAHSVEELEEWLMRAQEDKEIRHSIEAHGLLSYSDRLLEEYRHSSNEVHIMSEQVDDVSVTCEEDFYVACVQTDAEFKWNFQIKTERILAHVALLKQEPGASFSLGENSPEPCTYSTGEQFNSTDMTYDITVSFKSVNPGLYEQWLVFDFDMRPVLLQKLKVKVGNQSEPQLVDPPENNKHPSQNLERWNRGNRVIIPCLDKTESHEELLKEYKPPQISLQYKPLDDSNAPMNHQNYKERMHSFLYREEMAEDQVVSRLNVQGTITLSATLYDPQFGMKIAPQGELFGAVSVPFTLTPDTPEGLVLRRGVQSALIAPVSQANQSRKVYEAIILRDTTSENKMHLQLSKRCCSDLKLQTNETYEMEVQFQLNRLKFCEMHKAVDLLPNTERVLPKFGNCSVPLNEIQYPKLNAKQQAAIDFIIGDTDGKESVAPLLIYGPFGTGKTFTLATAAKELVRQPCTRVLICTLTNSSADLYVNDHFHPYISSGHHEMKPLRIKANKQGVPVSATDKITQSYCLLSQDGQFFLPPTKSALDCHRIVITTTAMARDFHDLKLPDGYFTHILIDEASQMLECEALMPLGLAGRDTRVVLAGDHMQMSPKLFSVEDDQRSNHTLLNRLFIYYQGQKDSAALKSRIIFNENYRSTKEIVEFVSKTFYVGKCDAIKAVGNVPAHPKDHPLRFHHVRGECHLDPLSMSWFNLEEVASVVEIVQNLLRDWPLTWGSQDQSSICVLSEGCQVSQIRKELRKRFLGRVTVENIANVQGKQFRVIVMTAIQTRDSLLPSDSPCLEVFNDARVLNTAMTRAQSQVVVVGDAGALCYFGKSSRIWKSYIEYCISKSSAEPKHITKDFIDGDIKEFSRFQRPAQLESSTQSVMSGTENYVDAILQEMKEEQSTEDYKSSERDSSECVSLVEQNRPHNNTSGKDALLDLLREQPNVYKRGELVMEKYNTGYIIPFGNSTEHIIIKGRTNLGKSFPGDEVVVERFNLDGMSQGKVLGITEEAESSRVFVCTLEDEDHHKPKGKSEFLRKIMVPLNKNTTKICTLISKKSRKFIPIWNNFNGDWKIVRNEHLNEEIKHKHVFVVEVVNWKKDNVFPLGFVIDILPIGSSLDEGLRILDAEYNVKPLHSRHITAEEACSPAGIQNGNRQDLRELITFTVDPEISEDLDDAISVKDIGNHYEVGVHIADVASFVKPGHRLDDDAKKRGATYYCSGKEPVYMFPKLVSTNHWSLLPGQDRMVISLVVKVDKATDEITDKTLQLSRINSDRKLSYEEAEDIIDEYSGEQPRFGTVEHCVAVAYRFAKAQRKARLRKDWSYARPDERRVPGKRRSHQMIEELNILFNSSVSECLIGIPETMFCTPLRCQASPNPEMVEELKEQYKNLIPLSSHLRYKIDHDNQILESESFHVLTSVWNEIQSAAERGEVDTDKMIDLIATDDIYPQLLPVIAKFRKCLDKAYVTRWNSSPEASFQHYSLNLDYYTHASSPIRRYNDIIIQRLLHSVLSVVHTPVPYSPQEIDILCQQTDEKCKRANDYEKKAEMISFAVNMKKQNASKLAFVVGVDPEGDSFKLSFPFDKHLFPDSLPLMYRDLQLEDQPLYDSKNNQMELKWRRRVYSVDTTKIHLELQRLQNCSPCTELPQNTWKAIVEAIDQEDWNRARFLIMSTNTKQTEHLKSPSKHSEMDLPQVEDDAHRTAHGPSGTSEMKHYVDLTLKLKPGDTLEVQMTSEVKRGYLTPTVQLVCIKPKFEICVDHAHSPVTCFSRCADHPSKTKYDNDKEYVKIWRPLCEMESAASAVDESDSIIIEDLELNLGKQGTSIEGSFYIPVKYIKEWAIECSLANCLLCIRKRGVKLSSTSDHLGEVVDPSNFTWVAHGVTTKFQEPKKSSPIQAKRVDFYINHLPMDTTPDCIFQKNMFFTVELIPKLLPDVRKEMAVNNVKSANDLVQKIALGQHIPKGVSQSPMTRWRIMTENAPEGLPKLNSSQVDAVEKALNNSFTLIQGPPGTGKTVVGVYIVYWFLELNCANPWKCEDPKDKNKKEVILYCGPSNKSVDVIAEYLLKFGDKLKPLRVYSRQMEMQEYPYPGSALQLSPKSLRQERSKPELRGITLHHRIREEANPHSREIKEFDQRIDLSRQSKGPELTEEEVENYKKLLNKARVFELQMHNVILCTCTAASTPNLIKTVNARQILIDECAMATEPQALIPLVCNKPEKIVLLGDHKQLRPIVKNELVRKLGMSKSLFERYFEMHKSRAVMLDTQYRMHEDICEFPSNEYYNGLLKTDVERPNSVLQADCKQTHIVFGDISGEEISLVVTTAKGNENSKANKKERDIVVKVAQLLVKESKINQQSIAILSPYNAQVSEIRKELKKNKMDKITVTTITKSQGSEWRYVILSTVRSLPSEEIETEPDRAWLSKHIGFVGDPNQINVGITRAKEGLCIIGNQELLSRSGAWRSLFRHYSAKNCVTEANKISVRKIAK